MVPRKPFKFNPKYVNCVNKPISVGMVDPTVLISLTVVVVWHTVQLVMDKKRHATTNGSILEDGAELLGRLVGRMVGISVGLLVGVTERIAAIGLEVGVVVVKVGVTIKDGVCVGGLDGIPVAVAIGIVVAVVLEIVTLDGYAVMGGGEGGGDVEISLLLDVDERMLLQFPVPQ